MRSRCGLSPYYSNFSRERNFHHLRHLRQFFFVPPACPLHSTSAFAWQQYYLALIHGLEHCIRRSIARRTHLRSSIVWSISLPHLVSHSNTSRANKVLALLEGLGLSERVPGSRHRAPSFGARAWLRLPTYISLLSCFLRTGMN